MVAKKHKSKRVSCAVRYKIQKKVRDHHKKAKKEARKNPIRAKKPQDPGIPSMWPGKEELLLEIEEHKDRVEEEKERQKRQRQSLHNKNRSLSDLLANAQQRADEFESSTGNVQVDKVMVDGAVSGSKDNSRRAYYQEFQKVVKNSDVILEVLDARDPLGCRSKHIEEMVISSGNKRLILVLNKVDLVPRENSEAWLKYLRQEFPTVAFKASTQQQTQNLSHSNVKIENASQKLLKGSECVGADDLLGLLKNYSRNANIKTAINVGVIGFPNTGKSSLINSLKRAKVCTVGSTPGQTKHTQEIYLDKHIKLLDCPGIVFSQGMEDGPEAVLRNCIKVDLLEDPIVPVEAIVARIDQKKLCKIYDIPAFRDTEEFLLLCARKMGRLRKGGIVDLEGTAKTVIKDWNSGKISYWTATPKSTAVMSSEVVQQWSKEFSLDNLMEM